ncbi:MAG TPA: hypothetical protein VHX12_07830 [Acidisoma sp.]|jgi:hypothetical protein|nr:hypothetical protein [Acidisoma sp.]
MKRLAAGIGCVLLTAMPVLTDAGTLCRPGETDLALRTLPPSLVASARTAFGYRDMAAAEVIRMTAFRCAAGRPFMCSWGANLPCGKANTAKNLPAVSTWCAANPDSDFVPAYVTGHDSLYQWHCVGGAAVAISPAALDAQGYFQSYWKAAR